MSAAKMVADSTQSDTDSRKKRNTSSRRKEKRSKRDRRRRRHSSSGGSTDSRHTRSGSESRSDECDSDIDLKKDLKPLNAYLRNPGQLLDQMLHSVRGSSLQRALPDVLKDMPMDELRKRCLEHLEVMSRKRMRRILAGDDPAAISSSGTDEDEGTEEEKEAGEAGSKVDSTAEEGKESTGDAAKIEDGQAAESPLSIAADELEDQALEDAYHHARPASDDEEPMEEGGAANREEEEEEEDEEWELEGGGGGEDMADVLFPEVEQDRMELLELEMRARAIKAMLALHEQREKDQKSRMKKN